MILQMEANSSSEVPGVNVRSRDGRKVTIQRSTTDCMVFIICVVEKSV